MKVAGPVYKSDVASSIPYDDNNALPATGATTVQEELDYLKNLTNVSASPGFTFGSSGNQTAGTYLLNDTVPSNTSGRIVPINNGKITDVFVCVQNATTFSIDIQKNVGGVFTTLVTITVTAARSGQFSVSVPVTLGMELSCRVSPTSANSIKNPVCGIIIKGSV